MTKKEAQALDNGLYRIYWKSYGSSLSAVGRTASGEVWFHPANWVSGPSVNWRIVRRVEALEFVTEIMP